MLGRVYKTVYLHSEAPAKPQAGDKCNGCGVCCAIAPCPAGILVSGRISGACVALAWHDETGNYRCELVAEPAKLPHWMRWTAPTAARLAQRFISAGSGCDCDYDPQREGHAA
jgi:hypothetical protein